MEASAEDGEDWNTRGEGGGLYTEHAGEKKKNGRLRRGGCAHSNSCV